VQPQGAESDWLASLSSAFSEPCGVSHLCLADQGGVRHDPKGRGRRSAEAPSPLRFNVLVWTPPGRLRHCGHSHLSRRPRLLIFKVWPSETSHLPLLHVDANRHDLSRSLYHLTPSTLTPPQRHQNLRRPTSKPVVPARAVSAGLIASSTSAPAGASKQALPAARSQQAAAQVIGGGDEVSCPV
jgi:hypothetical protein